MVGAMENGRVNDQVYDLEEFDDIDCLPVDLLADIFAFMVSFRDLASASSVCKKWHMGVNISILSKEKLSFKGWNANDDSTSRIVGLASNLKELDISSCKITNDGLIKLSSAKCISNLCSLSLCGMTGITDKGVISLITRAAALKHLNLGGTLASDESLYSIAASCPHLITIDLWSCCKIT